MQGDAQGSGAFVGKKITKASLFAALLFAQGREGMQRVTELLGEWVGGDVVFVVHRTKFASTPPFSVSSGCLEGGLLLFEVVLRGGVFLGGLNCSSGALW